MKPGADMAQLPHPLKAGSNLRLNRELNLSARLKPMP
jgi:hypothetical protein